MSKVKFSRMFIIFTLLFYLVGGLMFNSYNSHIHAEASFINDYGIVFTEQELDYINQSKVIKAVSIDGVAPLHYRNSKNEIVGIAVSIMDEISLMTDLKFEYELLDSVNAVFDSGGEIVFGVDPIYRPDNIVLTNPYLTSKSILFMNSDQESENLEGKTFAAIEGVSLPDNIDVNKVKFYKNREEALDAVEKGEACFGYGNEYSVAYYTIRNDYKKIITIPTSKESRNYSIGLDPNDKVLLSILNKAINKLDAGILNEVILKEASTIEKPLSISMVLNAYGSTIFSIIFVTIIILLLIIRSNIKSKKELSIQNKRYLLLSNTSNECMFEYDVKHDEIVFSDKCADLFNTEDNIMEIYQPLQDIILAKSNGDSEVVSLKLSDNNIKTFKVIKSDIYDDKKHKLYIIGKLIDISEEVAEKEKLINKSELDGLTNLYNNITSQKLVGEILENKDNRTDAFILIDCDKFKDINDYYGHLEGDLALKNVAKLLQANFNEGEIISRIGGDEFSVYVVDVKSKEALKSKLDNLNNQIREKDKKHNLTISVGIRFVDKEKSYEKIFKEADLALYRAKHLGGAQTIIFNKDNFNKE